MYIYNVDVLTRVLAGRQGCVRSPMLADRNYNNNDTICVDLSYIECWVRSLRTDSIYKYYTQFPSQDSGLFGPNPWKVLAPPSSYLSRFKLFGPNPWNKSLEGKSCDGNWVHWVSLGHPVLSQGSPGLSPSNHESKHFQAQIAEIYIYIYIYIYVYIYIERER